MDKENTFYRLIYILNHLLYSPISACFFFHQLINLNPVLYLEAGNPGRLRTGLLIYFSLLILGCLNFFLQFNLFCFAVTVIRWGIWLICYLTIKDYFAVPRAALTLLVVSLGH